MVFVDEIDTTLRLDFTDDFFAAIRFLYQNRAADPELQRLSFVLIGVATPGDLIKDAARTPFNIGHRIELTDFTFDEACALVDTCACPERSAASSSRWTLRWTGGHPVPHAPRRPFAGGVAAAGVDGGRRRRAHPRAVPRAGRGDRQQPSVRARHAHEEGVQPRGGAAHVPRRARGKRVPDKELDQVTSWLKLSGIVCRRDGLLRVRNAVYEQVFDERWARDHCG